MATSKKQDDDYRPGTLGWHLTQAGWTPVEREKQHPLWEKDGQTLAAYDAWTIELRRIWKETRAKQVTKEQVQ